MTSLKPPPASTHDGPVQKVGSSRTRRLSRSPQPYHRHSDGLYANREWFEGSKLRGFVAYAERQSSSNSSESGTEADDERGSSYLKGLPAPPLRARKGLRGATPLDQTPVISPLPTPPIVEQDRKSFFERVKPHKPDDGLSVEEKRTIGEKYTKRKRAEITRRGTETVLLFCTGLVTFVRADTMDKFALWRPEMVGFIVAVIAFSFAYPFRMTYGFLRQGKSLEAAVRRGFHIPSKFDPGSLLYPVFIPALVAASLFEQMPFLILPNMMLGLSSAPRKLIPWSSCGDLSSYVHWSVSTMPLLTAKIHGSLTRSLPPALKSMSPSPMSLEMLLLLYPLHRSLLPTLEYLVTTSLDPAELQLLSAALINLFLFATSPQAQILKALLWLGGLSIFISCRKLLAWEVTLARIPPWKFQRKRKGKELWQSLDDTICRRLVSFTSPEVQRDSSDDEGFGIAKTSVAHRSRRKSLKINVYLPISVKSENQALSAVESHGNGWLDDEKEHSIFKLTKPGRRNTFSFGSVPAGPSKTTPSGRPKRSLTPNASSFLSLTLPQARVRKWLYALYAYLAVLCVALVPVRDYVSTHALSESEPFGWALGYLFGNIAEFRFWVASHDLERWIRYANPSGTTVGFNYDARIERIRQTKLGPANTRLLLCGYCVVVLMAGIVAVLRLTSVVEVDTRRKIFHGIMVAMLLPTIFVDPCFIALALALILAIFLLLDLFRASQLPPISKPLTHFLAPYVDGRDHRGPVIVSHMFLLVGCAVPLWLSLAGAPRVGSDPWEGWEVGGRDVSMVSGVVCVGMGDAAASLIGRRFGKTKWFWGGGKSLEGSLAFTAAVTFGLMASYAWLIVGGWVARDRASWFSVVLKAMVAAAGASMTETLCTSANDNVIVPLALWLLVRGLNI